MVLVLSCHEGQFPAVGCESFHGPNRYICAVCRLGPKVTIPSGVPVNRHVENKRVVAIGGTGLDAQLMRTDYEGWDDPNAYAVSHVGWGLNPAPIGPR